MASEPKAAKPLARPPGQKRWPTLLLMSVIFVTGVAMGISATLMYVEQRTKAMMSNPGRMPYYQAERIAKSLDLTADQEEKIRAILVARWEEIMQTRRLVYYDFKPILDREEREIAELLRSDQQQQWKEQFAAMRRRFNPPPKPVLALPETQPASPASNVATAPSQGK